VAPPFKQAEFDIMYGKGISREGDLLDCAVHEKIVDKAGSWFSFQGDRIGQGRENVKLYLEQHPDVCDQIEGMLLDTLRRDQDQEEAADAGTGGAAGGKKTAASAGGRAASGAAGVAAAERPKASAAAGGSEASPSSAERTRRRAHVDADGVIHEE
jgi:hypothetical protein